jgi:hypothetical protein
VPVTKSANVVAGLSYVLGGLLFAGYLFLTLAFVVHVIERAWHIPSTVASAGRDDRVDVVRHVFEGSQRRSLLAPHATALTRTAHHGDTSQEHCGESLMIG